MLALILCLLALLQPFSAYDYHTTPQDIEREVAKRIIYYGSTVRFQHEKSDFHLHSHDVKYGWGSGQQSVTAFREDNDYNSLWTIKSQHGDQSKFPNDKVLCGDIIRIEHVLTRKNLHSHDYVAQLSRKFEVSGYGDDGNGDGGDNWQIVCEGKNDGTPLKAFTTFYLQHVDTKRYLYTERGHNFHHQNCGHNCPITGQLEVACDPNRSYETRWKITSGLFYLFDEEDESSDNSNGNGGDNNSRRKYYNDNEL